MLRLSVIVLVVLVCASAIQVWVNTHIVSEDTLLVVGSELTLECKVDGHPVPDVSWYKNYAQIFSDDRINIAENRLTVSRVNKTDTGLYSCYAVNSFSSHQSSVLITVEDPRWLSTREEGKTSVTNKEDSTTETTESDLFRLYIPPTCKDNPYFKCNLIVRSKVCSHKFYSKFCCKSCVEARQLDVRDLQLQANDRLY